ncbi:hypothetical protein BDZ89DRAFT_1065443, partial [Hymenopellis radicata]
MFHRRFSHDRLTYVVLDLCTGGDLCRAVILRDYSLQRTDRIRIAFLQILNVVHHCHQRGVFHRSVYHLAFTSIMRMLHRTFDASKQSVDRHKFMFAADFQT